MLSDPHYKSHHKLISNLGKNNQKEKKVGNRYRYTSLWVKIRIRKGERSQLSDSVLIL